MNEEPPAPFDTIGDEPVEARIVAWVLGEASAFEAAELERLCEERPELLVFRRRMRALHGLLTEAEAAEPDHSWKLPPEKRRVLDEIFGEEKVIKLDPQQERRIRHSGRRAFLAIAACVALTFFVIRLAPWKHEAEAVIEVKPRTSTEAGASASNAYSPQFFGTEFEKIKSRNSLEKVVDNLELTKRWNTDKESAIKRVKDSIETENIRGTNLLSIRVRDANEADAREVTQEVVKAYKAYRTDLEQKEADKGLVEFKKAIRDQEDKVEERRKVLATIVRTKGIIYKGQDSFYGQSGVDEDQGARSALENYNDLQRDKMQLESQISSLMKSDSEQSMATAAGLDLPDNTIRTLQPQYLEAKRQLEILKVKGQGANHPEVLAAADQVNAMKNQLEEGVVSLRSTLQAKLKVAKDSLKSVEAMKDDTREDAIKRGLDAQDYADAKREFETDQQLLQAMKLKEINEQMTARMSEESIVVHEMPSQRESKSSKAAPAAAPAAQTAGTYKVDSPPASSSRQAGLQESARQAQLAKHPSQPRPLVAAADAPMTEPEAAAAMESLPAITGDGLEKGAAGDGSDFAMKSEAQAPAAESAVRDKTSGGEVPSRSEAGVGSRSAASHSERLDITAAPSTQTQPAGGSDESWASVDRSELEPEKQLSGNNIDAIPNPPNRSELGVELSSGPTDAKPPVLGGKDSGNSDAYGEPASVGGKLDSLRDVALDLAEDGKKLREEMASGNSAMKLDYRGESLKPEGSARLSNTAAESLLGTDQVRRSLYTAEGNYNLGKYDDAKKEYERTLSIDPNNSAARRGLENVETAKSDYYRASHDHTRAELLSQVDSAWELSIPADNDIAYKQELFTKRKDMEYSLKLPGDAEYSVAAANKLFGWAGLDEATKARVNLEPSEPKLTELLEEIPASENPYSTFSLNISDASFQLAKAALVKGERPDPASIKTEQFYNAVDYGDPAPASNEPVAATVEQSAHPVIPGRNLVRVALRTGSVGRSAVQPLRLTLLVDQSGSMVREDRRASMEHALSQLAVLLTKADLVTVIGFSRTPHLLAEAWTGDQAGKLGDLVNQTASEGGTNLEEAMKLGGEKAVEQQLAGAQNRIVLFTDGAANLGDANPERLAGLVKSFRQQGLAFDIAGIGADGLNDRLLGELARNGNGRYYVVGDEKNDSFARQLAGAFRPAAENVKVQVNFNPQRVGKYKLIGFEKDRLKTEDFRNDAVDAAELAAEEAGVAIYQVEPLAGGSGEIGEVSVRFRDAAGKEMVERTWTIPYDEKATAFDRATPSMQLAGLSLLAAEKLKGGPMADAIDFKQLTGPSALVKQFYGGSPRVSEMLQVIEKLK